MSLDLHFSFLIQKLNPLLFAHPKNLARVVATMRDFTKPRNSGTFSGFVKIRLNEVNKMSRSRRHTPIQGITTADSEKWDKRLANKTLRHHNKILVNKLGENAIPLKMNQVMTPWQMGKDGKQYFDPRKDPKSMRK